MRNKIRAFREFWLDCYSSALLSMLRSYDQVSYNSVYCNNYEYILSKIDLDNGRKFFSLQTDNHIEEFETVLFDKVIHYDFLKEENMTKKIKDILNEGMFVFLGVDIFYWIDDNYNWNRNHFNHYSLITDYEEKTKKYTVFETGAKGYNEYKVDEKTVMNAAQNFKKIYNYLFE